MISMIWISQTAIRFADIDLFATILCGLILMWIVSIIKGDEEGGVTGMFHHYLIAGFLFCAKCKFWNNSTLPQEERQVANPKKEEKKTKETPPPVLVDNPKKRQKKGKRSSKKNFCKENIEPTVTKKETKMFSSLDICGTPNRDKKFIYENLYKHILTDTQLRMNHFPHEGFQPWTQVAADDNKRTCARCNKEFEIFNGLYLSDTKCSHHPRKPTFVAESRVRLHGCCNAPPGSPPCAVSNHHVTVQHRQRPLTKTSSRRHVRKDLQQSVFSLDCEMCFTTDGLEVVRVGLVNVDGQAVYDGYVKPKNKILDYNTMYSGVDKHHLQKVNVTIDDVKRILSSFIHEDTILVGHALNNDLAALGLIHNTIVDTSVLYANPRIPSKKTALKTLASNYLGIQIQEDPSGHDCIDDARASLQLALLKLPPSVPRPLSEQNQSAEKQQNVEKDLVYEPEQQLPLVEIQNFHYNTMYDFSQRAQIYNSPLLYNPNLGYYTPYLRRGV